ncbi:MAG: hypothetical protein ACUZ8H_10385, partial [Candidatus Anammoxibacter sp.]
MDYKDTPETYRKMNEKMWSGMNKEEALALTGSHEYAIPPEIEMYGNSIIDAIDEFYNTPETTDHLTQQSIDVDGVKLSTKDFVTWDSPLVMPCCKAAKEEITRLKEQQVEYLGVIG